MQAAVAGALDFHDEIDARAAVQLADDHALGPVDDELAAAEHDGDVAQVDLLLDGLLLGQAEPDLEGAAVGQPQLPAFVGLVARFSQLVADVFQPQRLVVAFDGENFPQHALDPLVLALLPGHLVLEKGGVAAGLDLGEIGDAVRIAAGCRSDGFPWAGGVVGRGSP